MTIETLATLAVGSKVVTNKGAVLTVTRSVAYPAHYDRQLGMSEAFSSLTLTSDNGKDVPLQIPGKLASHLAPQLKVANA